MELTAAVRGLSQLKRPTRVELVTDSVYVGTGLSEWLARWKSQGWKRKEKGRLVPVKNEDLWRELDRLLPAAGMPQDVGPAARAGVAAARAVGEEDDLGLADGCGASRRVHACRFRYGSGILGGSGGRQERLGSLGGRRSRVRG